MPSNASSSRASPIVVHGSDSESNTDTEIQLLSSPPILTEQERRDKVARKAYKTFYPLAWSPPPGLAYEFRYQVIDYLKAAPTVDIPEDRGREMFARLRRNIADDENWKSEVECIICRDNTPPPLLLLPCGCRHSIYHDVCLRRWHQTKWELDALFPCEHMLVTVF
ncbi:hypothetical protein B0H14DRAFT_3003918 [Mycena olivaceomarginata]|nr:hypothetical protein B0H14DRAFT_3003918 [Mycena olivaceomarginata]